jgi:hypothetical protein
LAVPAGCVGWSRHRRVPSDGSCAEGAAETGI